MKTTMKRIALIIMSLIMTFVMCVSMNATHMSAWTYSEEFENYGTRIVVETYPNPYSTAEINFVGKTYDLIAYTDACILYSDDVPESEDYTYATVEMTLDEYHPENVTTSQMRKRIREVTTDEIEIADISTLMHTYGMSIAEFATYTVGEEGYDAFDSVYAESNEIDNPEHSAARCDICTFINYYPDNTDN